MSEYTRTTKKSVLDHLREFLIMNFGVFLFAFNIHFFLSPNNFALGGISGISILLSYYLPNAPVSILMLFVSAIIIGMGYFAMGRDYAIKSSYGAAMLSAYTFLLEALFPFEGTLTDEKFLELIFGVMLPGISASLLFQVNASVGGTAVLGRIISKNTRLKPGSGTLLVDIVIALWTGILYGVETLLFVTLGVILKGLITDGFIDVLNRKNICTIVTSNPDIAIDFISNELLRGATTNKARGAFTNDEKTTVTTVVSSSESYQLAEFVRENDSTAFMTVTNATQVLGKAFKE